MKKDSRENFLIIFEKNTPMRLLVFLGILAKIIAITLIVMHRDKIFGGKTNTFNVIEQRSSVRSYTAEVPSEQETEKLLRAAMAAPSSRNVQPWVFYVITSAEILETLAEALPSASMLSRAPLAIVIAGDTRKGNPNEEQVWNWIMDCSAASQNLLLAAHSMGLGAVWTGVFPYQQRIAIVKETLNIPGHITPLNIIPVGYPDGDHPQKDKWDPGKIHYVP